MPVLGGKNIIELENDYPFIRNYGQIGERNFETFRKKEPPPSATHCCFPELLS